MWLFGLLLSTGVAGAALYYLAPGAMLAAVMRLARRRGRLGLREVEVDGHRVPCLDGGQGEPLLLLHGFAANKDHWTMIAPYLTRHFHVYAPDLPGFGDASRLDDAGYGLDTQLERIASLADALGLDSFHVGGNSMGGYLAAMFAARYPDRVRSLWLLAPAGVMASEPSEVLKLIEAGDNPLITNTLADFERLAALCFSRQPPMPAQFKRALLARARAEAPFNAKIFDELFAEPVALESRVEGLATRTLLVWGDEDRIVHPSGIDVLAGLLPNGQARLMKRMGHVPMLERPAETAADLLRFHGIAR
ncbi:MAG: alpha/beta hydrolase [Gammaproteobacteria bacterium]